MKHIKHVTSKKMKLKELLEIQEISENLDSIKIRVEKDFVWDYKDQNGELRLIHEPIKGLRDSEYVTFKELQGYWDLDIVSETVDKPFAAYSLAKQGNRYVLILTF